MLCIVGERMTAALLALALLLAGASLPAADVALFVDDVVAVVEVDAPLVEGDRTATGRLLVVWAWKEAAYRANAIGDGGKACGVLQLHAIARAGHTCAELTADRRLALRVGLAWMRQMRDTCGSVRRGLLAYASGSCFGSLRARALVDHRLKLAGGL
jgi:hypothetical protein